MRPIEKTSFDLFQKLRARYSPITLGDETADSTSDPSEARYFNFMYKDNDNDVGNVTVSLLDGSGMKIFYSDKMIDRIENTASWYALLHELRGFAKRNLLTFDARDISKDQLDARDFQMLSKIDGKLEQKQVNVSESSMFGTSRRSYQTLESVKLIVQHSKPVAEDVPGARSRSIHNIYLERADGERYKFPYNYLTGARAMARHVNEGGTPYDPLGQHILSMIKEMRDLSKFARMTKRHSNEDAQANEIREQVVNRYQELKGTLSSLSNSTAYKTFSENFEPIELSETDENIALLRERFTRQVWDTTMEDLLPAVNKAIQGTAMAKMKPKLKEVNEFETWASNIVENEEQSIEIAQKIMDAGLVGNTMDSVYAAVRNYVSAQHANDANVDEIAQIIMDKTGVVEATTQGTVGTTGTVGTSKQPTPAEKAAANLAARNVSRMTQSAGIKTGAGQIGKMVQAMVSGKPLPRDGAQTIMGLGNELIQNAMEDPRKAAQLSAMLKRMKQNEDVSEEFDQWYESNIVNEKTIIIRDDDDEIGTDNDDIEDIALESMYDLRKLAGMPLAEGYEDRIAQVANRIIAHSQVKSIKKSNIDDFIRAFGNDDSPEVRMGGKASADFFKDVKNAIKGKVRWANNASASRQANVAADNEKLSRIAHEVMVAVGNSVPDGDPFDMLEPKLRRMGIDEYQMMDWVDRACKKFLGIDYFGYLKQVWDDVRASNPNPWG